jgi:hypothetical protein
MSVMPQQTSWYPGYAGRVILLNYEGALTVEDVAESSAESNQLVGEGTPPLYLICDMRSVTRFPLRVTQLRRATSSQHAADFAWVIIVGGSGVMSTFAAVISQLAGVRLRNVSTPEEALAFIQKEDPSLSIDRTRSE